MRWKINGKDKWISDKKYIIDWDKKSKSKGQFQLKQFLKNYWENYIAYEEYRIPGNLLYVDLLCASKLLAVEFHGVGHFENGFNKFFHRNRVNYLNAIKRDFKKAKILEDNNYQLIEIFPEDLDNLSHKFFVDKFNIYL